MNDAVGRHGPLLILPAPAEAVAFIVDSWCKSYEAGALAALGPLKPESLTPEGRRAFCKSNVDRVRGLVADPSTRALVAVVPDAPSIFHGYVVHSPGECVHYVYVLQEMRRSGLGAALLKAAGVSSGIGYTHHTSAGRALVRRFGLTYRPHGQESQR